MPAVPPCPAHSVGKSGPNLIKTIKNEITDPTMQAQHCCAEDGDGNDRKTSYRNTGARLEMDSSYASCT